LRDALAVGRRVDPIRFSAIQETARSGIYPILIEADGLFGMVRI
jgi:hypothetical protein